MNLPNQATYVRNRALIVFTIMNVAILEVLDSTIITVALPHIEASLHANNEQITWILTSYIVSAAIMIPLTGFLTDIVGRKRLLLINVLGFMLSSFACGATSSLDQMITFRLLQGAFGASLIPTSQAILREVFPREQQNKAMAIWGLGIMIAPILGPTIGGYITEHMSWRWIFYINTPFCIASLILSMFVINETERIQRHIDWLGIVLMIFGIGGLQLFLDQGNNKGWFGSIFIQIISLITVAALLTFITRTLRSKNPLVNFKLYHDRNFTVCNIAIMIFMGCMLGLISLQPIFLENLHNYPVITTGLLFIPRGLASTAGIILVTFIMKKIDVRIILTTALLLCACGSFVLAHDSIQTSFNIPIIGGIIQGFGMGLFMVPLITYSLLTIPATNYSDGSGLFSYSRMLGNSVGVSIFTTILTRENQINWHSLTTHTSKFNPYLHQWLAKQSLNIHDPIASARLSAEISKQAFLLSFIDIFYLSGFIFLLLIPIIFFIKKVDLNKKT